MSSIHQANVDLDFTMWKYCSTQDRLYLSAGCMRRGLITRTMILSLQFSSWILTILFSFWCPSSCCSSSGAQGECLLANKLVHRPFKRMLDFSAFSHLTQMDKIPTDFHSKILWGFYFPEMDSSLLRWDLSYSDILLDSQPPHMGVGPAHLHLPFLPVLIFFFICLVTEFLFS